MAFRCFRGFLRCGNAIHSVSSIRPCLGTDLRWNLCIVSFPLSNKYFCSTLSFCCLFFTFAVYLCSASFRGLFHLKAVRHVGHLRGSGGSKPVHPYYRIVSNQWNIDHPRHIPNRPTQKNTPHNQKTTKTQTHNKPQAPKITLHPTPIGKEPK